MDRVMAQALFRPEFENFDATEVVYSLERLRESLDRGAARDGYIVVPETIQLRLVRPGDEDGDLPAAKQPQWWFLRMTARMLRR